MECGLKYRLEDRSGAELASGEAKASLDESGMSVKPASGSALLVDYRDTVAVRAGDYRLAVILESGEELNLYHMGRDYEGFVSTLNRLRNERLIDDLLMSEPLRMPGVRAQLSEAVEGGGLGSPGGCELRLYETAVVVIPDGEDPFRLPLCDLTEARREDHTLILVDEDGRRLEFSMMGRRLEPSLKAVNEAVNELSLKVQSALKELAPSAAPSAVWGAAALMKEGKAASRGDIDSAAPGLWTELEKKLEAVGIGEEYEFLKRLSFPDRICIGLKRGLMGDLTGEYVWFLVPVYGKGAGDAGNAMAVEAAAGEGGGRATYFFRITGRADYPGLGEGELHAEVERLTKKMNRAMLAVNFRREPIYLPDESLDEPRYSRYRVAVRKIPELRLLRGLFIGRVHHRSAEQWRDDVTDLLEFNVRSGDDSEKWRKGAGDGPDDDPV